MSSGNPFAGLLGSDIAHSLSPRMHAQWFAEANIEASYALFPEPSEAAARARVESLLTKPHFLGLNITAPYKALLLEDSRFRRTPRVERTGAANTLHRTPQGDWTLENTDVFGIAATLERLLDVPAIGSVDAKEVWKIVCLGAGGAARAVPEALRLGTLASRTDPRVAFLCRDPEKAEHALRQPSEAHGTPEQQDVLTFEEGAERLAREPRLVVVNTLPLGLPGSATPINTPARNLLADLFSTTHRGGVASPSTSSVSLVQKPGRVVCYFDMLYLPSDGLACARDLGLRATGGALMLQEQGRQSFRLWVGVEPKSDPLTSSL